MERELWQAVIKQALDDVKGSRLGSIEVQRRARNEVSRWLDSRDFAEVCEMAGVDPDDTRAAFPDDLPLVDVDPSRYTDLDADLVEEVRYTSLDRQAYLNFLRKHPDPLTRAQSDLDQGLTLGEAIQNG